jgi:hypothetical protein
MTISRNLSILAEGANATGVLAVTNGGTGVTTSTGTGSTVLSASPTLTGTLTVSGTIDAAYVSGTSNMLIRNLSGTNRIDSYNDPITANYPLQILGSPLTFATADVERMRILAGGAVVINQTSAGSGERFGVLADSGNVVFFRNTAGTGVYLVSGNNSWSAASDERIKDIIEPINDGLAKVNSLRTVIGKYKSDPDGTRRSFLIAQDVQAVLPEAVNVQSDEIGTLGLQITDTIPLLVAAIKELSAKNDSLTARIAALEAK